MQSFGRPLAAATAAALLLVAAPGRADAPPVVVTIKPVHSLVAAVMKGVGEPYLLLKGGASPHSYSLRPSEARRLSNARVVFWVGKDLEAFLARPLASLSRNAAVVALNDAKGVRLLATREGGIWEAHEHDHGDEHDHDKNAARDHDHDDHNKKAEHDHKKGADHDHDEHADHDDSRKADHDDSRKADHDHDEKARHGHAHDNRDMHIWLDPHNAEAMVRAIAAALVKADPAHAASYRRNAAATLRRLEALEKELGRILASVRNRRYLVFHDAYQYFEKRYRLAAAGSVTLNPQRQPGAKRLYELRKRIVDNKARCVFVEPQFPPKIVNTLIAGTPAKKGTLDPIGASLPEGPNAYFTLMRNLANALRQCLA